MRKRAILWICISLIFWIAGCAVQLKEQKGAAHINKEFVTPNVYFDQAIFYELQERIRILEKQLNWLLAILYQQKKIFIKLQMLANRVYQDSFDKFGK
ncbi:MAG: hypothetical protein ACOZBH_04140 [Patescibacteria group bacterium]